MEKQSLPVTNPRELTGAMARSRAAQKKFAEYTQEQVDRIFLAAATAANQMRIPLAKLAVEETGMGVVEDKVIKNHFASEYIYNAYKDAKTCGVLEEDTAFGTQRIAEPIGVIAAVIPTTNPTSTAIFKTLICLKTRNGIIISPHPRAKGCTIAAARVVLEAAVAAGAPEDIIGWIDQPSLEMTNQLMRESDLILATGGPGMVKAAYSSGKPALGVGPGNTPAVIDDTADILLAVSSVIHTKTFDNGMICASEQSVVVLDGVYEEVKAEFVRRGCHILTEEEARKVRETILVNGALNAKIVGQPAARIAAMAGVEVPESTKILIGEVESTDLSEAFAHEKLSPVLAMYRAADFEDALNKADTLVRDGGFGHTASIYLDEVNHREKLDAFAHTMKACRILVNTPSSQGGIGDLYNFKLAPSLTLGCGSWGGNSVSENVGIKHLLNIKTVAIRRENMLWFRAPEKVYFKKGCLPVALAELKAHKKAFIVTDSFLYNNGYTKPIEQKLDEMGISHTTFYNVAPDPTLACAREGAAQMAAFQPDLILAIGGGSAMVNAKAIGIIINNPEFADVRSLEGVAPTKKHAVFTIAVPTTAGTAAEVTINYVITDVEKKRKFVCVDTNDIPEIAVVDPDMMSSMPKGLTAATGMDALTHAIEGYITKGHCTISDMFHLEAIKLISENLRGAVQNTPEGREGMALGQYIAGMGFSNVGLGIVHSMAHGLSALYDTPHGVACAILLPVGLEYNKTVAGERYRAVGKAMGVKGIDEMNDVEAADATIAAVKQLSADVGIPANLQGILKEEDIHFLAESAFADACCPGNPRDTSVEEIEALYKSQL